MGLSADDPLADLMRADLGALPGLSEKRMFGGYCFMLHGNMVCGISDRMAMYRVGKLAEEAALRIDGATPMIHGGRRMGGFVVLALDAFQSDADARDALCVLAVAHASGLPPK